MPRALPCRCPCRWSGWVHILGWECKKKKERKRERLKVKGRDLHENIVLGGWTERVAALKSGRWTRKDNLIFLKTRLMIDFRIQSWWCRRQQVEDVSRSPYVRFWNESLAFENPPIRFYLSLYPSKQTNPYPSSSLRNHAQSNKDPGTEKWNITPTDQLRDIIVEPSSTAATTPALVTSTSSR